MTSCVRFAKNRLLILFRRAIHSLAIILKEVARVASTKVIKVRGDAAQRLGRRVLLLSSRPYLAHETSPFKATPSQHKYESVKDIPVLSARQPKNLLVLELLRH